MKHERYELYAPRMSERHQPLVLPQRKSAHMIPDMMASETLVLYKTSGHLYVKWSWPTHTLQLRIHFLRMSPHQLHTEPLPVRSSTPAPICRDASNLVGVVLPWHLSDTWRPVQPDTRDTSLHAPPPATFSTGMTHSASSDNKRLVVIQLGRGECGMRKPPPTHKVERAGFLDRVSNGSPHFPRAILHETRDDSSI